MHVNMHDSVTGDLVPTELSRKAHEDQPDFMEDFSMSERVPSKLLK